MAGVVSGRRNPMRIMFLALVVALAAIALPEVAAADTAPQARAWKNCGPMAFGATRYEKVSVQGGTCVQARRLMRSFRAVRPGCSAQPSLAAFRLTCGRYRGATARVVAYGAEDDSTTGHVMLRHRGLTVDVHPRAQWVSLNGGRTPMAATKPRASTRFGTANGLYNMQAEHEMITRAALSCGKDSTIAGLKVTVKGVVDPVPNCFEPRGIDNLAGWGTWSEWTGGTSSACAAAACRHGAAYAGGYGFGAVGAPDNMSQRWVSGGPDWWHCDGADWLPLDENGGADYPQTMDTARTRLIQCRTFADYMMNSKLQNGYEEDCGYSAFGTTWQNPCTGMVPMAANLLNANGTVKAGMEQTRPCSFAGYESLDAAWVKCSVLEPFGYVLHVVQDFWSHSNYADAADPNQPVSITNPPGFLPTIAVTPDNLPTFWDFTWRPDYYQSVGSSWYDNPNNSLWPITGCYVDCTNRILHNGVLTKDLSGGIDYTKGANATIGAAGNPRGQVNDNTLRAIRFAILETRRQWAIAQQQIIKTYGQAKGEKMICALTKDDPVKACS